MATKRFAPKIPLWALLVGCMFLDILSIIFLPALWPSHGLAMALVWTLVATLSAALIVWFYNSKNDNSGLSVSHTSLVFGLLVFSHWILDFIGWPMTVGDPNSTATAVPLLFNDIETIGLGVYSTLFGALLMDLGVFLVGLIIYLLHRRDLNP